MSEHETRGVIAWKPMSDRDIRYYQRGLRLAFSLGDTRWLNDDGTTRKLCRGMRLGPRRAWTVARLWCWRLTPGWLR
jgi:hypothetical protein